MGARRPASRSGHGAGGMCAQTRAAKCKENVICTPPTLRVRLKSYYPSITVLHRHLAVLTEVFGRRPPLMLLPAPGRVEPQVNCEIPLKGRVSAGPIDSYRDCSFALKVVKARPWSSTPWPAGTFVYLIRFVFAFSRRKPSTHFRSPAS